jgi:Tfp pilus assembly protein PilO
MDKEYLIKQFTSKKAKDYTYAVIFFLIFSFFIFFVIRPNLVNVFSLQEELGKLRIMDAGYENVIKKIINIQTFLETNRSDLYLLDQAVSSTPQINKLVQDIETAASASGIIVTQINISKIDLKDKAVRTSKNVLTVNIATHTGFKEARVFVDSLISGRRLKTLKSITLDRNEKGSSSSAELDIKIDLEGYYL